MTDPGSAITSASATAAYAADRFASAFVLGSPALAETLEGAGISIVAADEAECVVVGLDRDLSYGAIDAAARAVRRGSAFLATNVDSTYPTPSGLAPGAGAIVAAVATAAETEPVVCGKPTPVFGALVRDQLVGDETWMVGDRPETDVALALAEGWASVLVLTGVTSDPSEVPGELTPDHVLASVAELPELIAKESPAPEPQP